MKFDEQSFIAAVRERDQHKKRYEAAMRWFCHQSGIWRKAKGTLLKSGATVQDAEEILQDAAIILIRSILKQKFLGNSSLSTFFIGICNKLHLNRRKQKRLILDEGKAAKGIYEPSPTVRRFLIEAYEEVKSLTSTLLSSIGEKCKTALLLWMKGYPHVRIKEVLNYETEQAARDRVSKCLKQLTETVHNDPRAMNIIHRIYEQL